MKKNITILLIFLSLLFTTSLYAQVTIGSLTEPEQAAILQVKEFEAVSGSGAKTANKGILLPRVKLNSATDISVITNDPDKIVELTGLLVYNVNTIGMGEGIYEWNGREWGLLETFSEETGAYIKKMVVQTNALNDNNAPTVNIGRFSFRFSPGKEVQVRLSKNPEMNETIGFHIGRYWDETSTTSGASIGYAYDTGKINFTSGNFSTWHNFHSTAVGREERREIWLADTRTNNIYNVQFILYTKTTIPTYIVIVTEY
jgi:hypothetical protein